MVNSKKVLAALPVPKNKGEKKSPEKLPMVEELKGNSHGKGKGKGKTVVSNWSYFSRLKYFVARSRVQMWRRKCL